MASRYLIGLRVASPTSGECTIEDVKDMRVCEVTRPGGGFGRFDVWDQIIENEIACSHYFTDPFSYNTYIQVPKIILTMLTIDFDAHFELRPRWDLKLEALQEKRSGHVTEMKIPRIPACFDYWARMMIKVFSVGEVISTSSLISIFRLFWSIMMMRWNSWYIAHSLLQGCI